MNMGGVQRMKEISIKLEDTFQHFTVHRERPSIVSPQQVTMKAEK